MCWQEHSFSISLNHILPAFHAYFSFLLFILNWIYCRPTKTQYVVQPRPDDLGIRSTSQLCPECTKVMKSHIFSLVSSLFHVHSIYTWIRAKCSTKHQTLIHRQRKLEFNTIKSIHRGHLEMEMKFPALRGSESPEGQTWKAPPQSAVSEHGLVRPEEGMRTLLVAREVDHICQDCRVEKQAEVQLRHLSWASYLKSLNLISRERIRSTSKGYFRG